MNNQLEPGKPLRLFRTILMGGLLLAVITPLSQFLTIKALNASIETDTPVGWALGLIISIILTGLVIRTLAKREVFGRANLALLYGMLALAVPLMNIGLVRQLFLSSHTVVREYMYHGNSTYRTAYNSLNDRWFPVVPTREGLAWSRAGRVLDLLQDSTAQQRQAKAQRLFEEWEEKVTSASPEEPRNTSSLKAVLPDLPMDPTAGFLNRIPQTVLKDAGLLVPLQQHLADQQTQSEQASTFLKTHLKAGDEWALSLLPSNLERIGYNGQERLKAETRSLPSEAQTRLEARQSTLADLEAELRSSVSLLGEGARTGMLEHLRVLENQHLNNLSRGSFQLERNRYVFRIDRDERRSILQMNGDSGPNQNLFAFITGLWNTPQERAEFAAIGPGERLGIVVSSIPWSIYLRPMTSWFILLISIFGFLMCVAEWLRRKWVSRENLPFPLVEVADYVIRHDSQLETAGDLLTPAKRDTPFNTLFLMGCAAGFFLLFAQGLGHYGFINGSAIIRFDFSSNIFAAAGGALKNLPTAVFVVSPIVIGIVYLLSLEMGFSIWFSFILYSVIIFLVRVAQPSITDGNWTGWSDGKTFPFTMEQLLGATLCYSVYHLWKIHKSGKQTSIESEDSYVSPKATRWGLIVLPLIIFALLWDLGVKNFPILIMVSIAVLAITIAVARVRAETGLPLGHAVYEFTKFPLIFGMTGIMGSKVFASFLNIVFLPTTLLFRTLPQQLENIELARRYRIRFGAVAVSGFAAVGVTLIVGMFSFLLFTFMLGQDFYGFTVLPPFEGGNSAISVATYPLWVGHFLGEPGLDRFTTINSFRMVAIAGGFAGVGLLLFLRTRFLKFPLHPVGYLVLLMSILYSFETPFQRVPADKPFLSSTIWGSALLAWLLKRMIVKYGGMNIYKQAKPLFVGLIVGSVFSVFFWNMLDLIFSIIGAGDSVPGDFIQHFIDFAPFTPAYF